MRAHGDRTCVRSFVASGAVGDFTYSIRKPSRGSFVARVLRFALERAGPSIIQTASTLPHLRSLPMTPEEIESIQVLGSDRARLLDG
jgi:hypothetical protein